jgi:DNA mismatch repair protein MutL
LGKSNEVPSIDFDTKDAIDIPVWDANAPGAPRPRINVNPSYNPFKQQGSSSYSRPSFNWEALYEGFRKEDPPSEPAPPSEGVRPLFANEDSNDAGQNSLPAHYQYKNRYILTSVKSGLMIIDQRRAHVRILFDRFLQNIRQNRGVSQRMLFPEMIEFSASEEAMLPYLIEDIEALGFELSNLGNRSYAINGVPSELSNVNFIELIHGMVSKSIETGSDVKDDIRESLALSMAYASAIPYGRKMSGEEMSDIVNHLFASSSDKYTPDGKLIISVIDDPDIDKRFK